MKKISFIIFFVFQCILISCENKKNAPLDSEKNTEINNETLETGLQLERKSYEELRLLRNEIYARKGYVFKDSTLNAYFSSQDWYTPNKEAEIILSDAEKQKIEAIKEAEDKLKPFNLPNEYEIVTRSDANGRPIDQIVYDIDNDGIKDVVSLGKNVKNDKQHTLFFYLSSEKKFKRIKLNNNNEFRIFPFQLEIENGNIEYGFGEDGSSAFCRSFKINYNSRIKKLQLIHYASSYRVMFGHLGKEIDLVSGNYKVIKEVSSMEDSDNIKTTSKRGKQETKLIPFDLINEKLYRYLDNIGNEYEKHITDEYGDDITDCREEIIRRLQLEFKYGKLSYLGECKVFKKELTDFVQSIDVNELLQSEDNSYSENYHLHRNLNLAYIEDEFEDVISLSFDRDHLFSISVNNYSSTGDEEIVDGGHKTYVLQFEIGKNCTFAFNKIIEVG